MSSTPRMSDSPYLSESTLGLVFNRLRRGLWWLHGQTEIETLTEWSSSPYPSLLIPIPHPQTPHAACARSSTSRSPGASWRRLSRSPHPHARHREHSIRIWPASGEYGTAEPRDHDFHLPEYFLDRIMAGSSQIISRGLRTISRWDNTKHFVDYCGLES